MSDSMPLSQRDERLALLITVVVLGLALSALVPLPTWELPLELFGSELVIRFSGPVQLLAVMVILICLGVDGLVRGRPTTRSAGASLQHSILGTGLATSATFWALPTLVAILGLAILQGMPWWGYQLALALLCGAAVAAVVTLQLASRSLASAPRQGLRLALNGVSYGIAYILFDQIFGARLRSLVSAPAILLVSGGLALELLRSSTTTPWRTYLYAGLTALVMGEIALILNYSRLGNRAGGALLFLVFYILTGLAQQHLWARLNRRVLVEYLIVLALGLGGVSLLA